MVKRIKITDDQLIEAVKISFSYMGVLRHLGLKQAGGSQCHYKRKIIKLKLDTSHFTGQLWNKGKHSNNRRSAEDILKLRIFGRREEASRLRRALVESGIEYKCSKCGQLPKWMGNPLTLDVDHINENWLDDRKDNLRFLCPNCHSQFSRGLLGN